MTAYVATAVYANSSTTNGGLAVLANTYPVRISRLEFYSGNGPFGFGIYHYSGANISAGTSIVPLPLRGGAPASTATAKSTVTISGTITTITYITCANHHIQSAGGTSGQIVDIADPGGTSYTFPFDYILAPGSALYSFAGATATNNTVALVTYFEELRLSWSF